MSDTIDMLVALHRQFQETGDYTSFSLEAKTYAPGCNIFSLLDYFFNKIPDNQKYAAVLNVYTMVAEDDNRRVVKYLKSVKPFMPDSMKATVGALADSNGIITVYRGGRESKDAARCISWTTSNDIAEFFAKRYLALNGGGQAVIYTGTIKPQDVIAYTDDRQEKEIVQYCGVKSIRIVKTIDRCGE